MRPNPESYLTFSINEMYFALPIKSVIEVIEKHNFTAIPHSPVFLKGILNYRGEILPIFDIKTKLNFKLEPCSSSLSVIIVIEVKQHSKTLFVGALVDQVYNVVEAFPDNYFDISNQHNEFYKSEFIVNTKTYKVLDMDNLFTLENKIFEVFAKKTL